MEGVDSACWWSGKAPCPEAALPAVTARDVAGNLGGFRGAQKAPLVPQQFPPVQIYLFSFVEDSVGSLSLGQEKSPHFEGSESKTFFLSGQT